MNANFDWSQYETATPEKSNTSGFDWSSYEEVKKEPKVDSMKREIGRVGKVVGSTVAGIPGDVADFALSAPQKIAEKLTGKTIPNGASQVLKALTPFGNLPTQQEISGSVEKAAPNLAPRNEKEKDWEDNLSTITSLLLPVPGGKAKAVDPKALKALYQSGKRLGLNEKQLAPLFHGKLTQGILGKIAGQGKDAIKELELTQNGLGSVYETLKTRGTKSIPLKAAEHLEDQLSGFRASLEKTLSASPEKQSLINFVQKAEDKLSNSGATGEELINFFQDINKSINWKAVHGGKKQLVQAKEFVKKALQSTDKSLANDFEVANKLWEKSASVINSLGPSKYRDFINISAATALVGALATGNLDSAEKIALTFAGKQAMAKVSTKLLTDPKWMNLHRKMLQAIKNRSPKAAQVIIHTLKNKIREEMPEDSEEFDSSISD